MLSLGVFLDNVDLIFLETNDGRPHLEQLRPCLAAHKPVFIDKPIAGTLVDAIKILMKQRLPESLFSRPHHSVLAKRRRPCAVVVLGK